jgi:hypothetical protein
MNQLEFIRQSITSLPRQSILFKDAIVIKHSPHIALFTCWGACVAPDGVYLMDGNSEWRGPLKEDQVNAALIISSLYQRMKIMPLPVSVVVAQYDNDVNATIFD